MQNSDVLFLQSKVPVTTLLLPFYITIVLSNVVANQLIHTQYGGVVPELHLERINKILSQLLMRH
jgi:tRNA A37 threonylcarbamoyltransferase TsaD